MTLTYKSRPPKHGRRGAKSREERTEWALDQLTKYGVRQPDTYTADELKYLNPGVPADFIDQHIAKRNKKPTV